MSQRYAGGMITANQNINYSGLFNGTASYLSLAGAAQYAIATSTTPFTVEAWIRPTSAGGLIFSEEFGSPTIVMACGLATSNDISSPAGLYPAFGYYTGAWTNAAASTTPIVLNLWTHIAFVFTGSTSKIYINGVDVTKSSSPTPATTWGVTATNGTNWFIGRRWDTGAGGTYFKGNISNFRFVNGTAVYTTDFTPPPRLSAIPNTVLLTCQSSTFFDASSYAATITNVGSAVVSASNPFYLPADPALGAATPGVWTISQANAAAAQRSWPMYDPEYNLNTSMVHGGGTNGSNNNTFLDSSNNNFSVTRNGETTQGTFTPFSKPNGYWSSHFDGTGDYLQVAGNSNLAFGNNNFTIECFFYVNSIVGFIYDGRNTGTQATPTLFFSGTTLVYYVSGANRIVSGNLVINTWYHLVVSRVSGNTRMFINGAQVGATYVDSTNYISNTSRPRIGGNGDVTNPSSFFNGYISNLRVLNGTGTTSVTVPTAPLQPVPNTQLLTCQSNRFIDNSSNAYTITKFADARTITYSPIYSPTAYFPEVNGGSVYFDGTGDYLDLTGSSNLAFDAGNWTVEFWFYTQIVSGDRILYDSRPAGTQGAYPTIYQSGTSLFFLANNTNLITSSGTIATGTWYHVVVSKVSGQTRMFLNGAQQGSTYTDSITYLNGASRPRIGDGGVTTGSGVSGYISNLRVLKGTGVTSVTVPTAPYVANDDANTQLLLSGTNASFIDNATNATILTTNATISTSQNKYVSGSMSFNGSSAYASLLTPFFPTTSRMLNVQRDFTVEGWVNPTTANTQSCMFYVNGNNNSYAGVRLDHAATGAIQLLVSSTGAAWAINTTSTTIIPTGQWTHLAVVRNGTAIIVYFNGNPIITATLTFATTLLAGTYNLLGALLSGNGAAYANYYNGYISDFRTTNYARYLGVFTPPTSTLQNQ